MRLQRPPGLVMLAVVSGSVFLAGCLEDDPPPDFGEGGEGGTGNAGGSGGTGNEGGAMCPGGCDDDNPCTIDTCDEFAGCTNGPIANGTSCADSDLCNGEETCLNGTCTAGPAVECDDGDACNGLETCDGGACLSGTPVECDDGDACNGLETCDGGACVAGTPVVCDDGDACNGLETCDGGACLPGSPPMCDDADLCTSDACDPALGCVFADITALCDDGDPCNGLETCEAAIGCISPLPVGALEDFETGAAGWSTGPLAGTLDSWVLSSVSGGAVPITFASTAYGNINNGDLGEEQSFLESPDFDLTGGGTVSFRTWVSNEDPGFDLEALEVSFDGGGAWQVLIEVDDPQWCSQENWVPITAPIGAANGTAQTRFRFVFDSVDGCCGPDGGWFVDDFAVVPTGAFDCDDADPCTVDVCVAGACVNNGEPACDIGPFSCEGSGGE